MAFPILTNNTRGRIPEAFDHIVNYIYQKPHTAKLPYIGAISGIQIVKYKAMTYGFEEDLNDYFYSGLIGMLCDPNISDGARYLLADSFCDKTPKRFQEEALKIIKALPIPEASECVPLEYRDAVSSNKAELIQKLEESIDYK